MIRILRAAEKNTKRKGAHQQHEQDISAKEKELRNHEEEHAGWVKAFEY